MNSTNYKNSSRFFSKIVKPLLVFRQAKTSSRTEKQIESSKPKVTEETYKDIPDGLVSQNNGTLPVKNSVQPKTEDKTYEEVSEHPDNDRLTTTSYQNVRNGTNDNGGNTNTSDSTNIHENVTPVEYEDIPDTKDYEPLKRVVYENTNSSDDTKVYTGLDNKRRHSKV